MPRSLHPLVSGCQMCQCLVNCRGATKYFLTVTNKTQSWHVSFNKCAFQSLMLWFPNQPKQQERRISVFPERMQQWVTISALLWVTSAVLLNGSAMNIKQQNIPFALEITGKSRLGGVCGPTLQPDKNFPSASAHFCDDREQRGAGTGHSWTVAVFAALPHHPLEQ